MKFFRSHHAMLFVVTLFGVLFLGETVAFAALGNGSESIINSGTQLGGTFDTNLRTLTRGILQAMHIVLIVLTAVAGMMVAFGIEDGKKFIWQALLGLGLAFNFGAFVLDTGLWNTALQPVGTAQVEYYKPDLMASGEGSSSQINILGGFMNNYTEKIITPGAKNILPYCLRLLVILAVVQATWELSMKFMSGDKIQYLLSMVLKMGFYMFLMLNWISFMGSLSEGFELLGLKAGGDASPVANNIVGNNCDRIVQFAVDCFSAIWKDISFDSLGVLLIMVAGLVALVYCLFMTALEMFMARIEFYTMALLSLPLLSFGVTTKFAFLTERAIGAMFNLAIKICAIAFISAMAVPFIESFITKLQNTKGIGEDIGIILQAVLAAGLIYILTKKIPALITGLLSGNPQLSGSSMIAMTAQTAAAVASGAGTLSAARTAAAAMGSGGVKGTLTQLGRNFAMSRSPVKNYRGAMRDFHSTLKYNADKHRTDITDTVRKQTNSKDSKDDRKK